MMRWPSCAWFVLLAVTLFIPTFSAAQDASAPPTAQALFMQAMARLGDGEFARAAELFETSLQLDARAATAFNLAITYRGLGRQNDALVLLNDVISGRYGAIEVQARSDVEALAERLDQNLVSLILTVRTNDGSEGHAADILVDHEPVESGTLPIRITLRLDPGEHILGVEGARLNTMETTESFDAGTDAERVIVVTPIRPARIRLHTDDPNAELTIEGVASARGVLEHEVAPGRYRVTVRNAAGSRESFVDVVAGGFQRLELSAPQARSRALWPWIVGAGVLLLGGGALGYWAVTREGDPRESADFPHVQALGMSF